MPVLRALPWLTPMRDSPIVVLLCSFSGDIGEDLSRALLRVVKAHTAKDAANHVGVKRIKLSRHHGWARRAVMIQENVTEFVKGGVPSQNGRRSAVDVDVVDVCGVDPQST